MKFSKKYIYIALSLSIFSCAKPPASKINPRSFSPTAAPAQADAPIIATIGTEKLNRQNLKTSLAMSPLIDSSSNDEILSDWLRKKLIVQEARSLGRDTNIYFKEEIAGNLKLVTNNFTEDQALINKIGNEAYDRYQKELNVSSIFVPISAYASGADTLKIYNELLNIRDLAIKNKDFETQAKRWSKDPKTAPNGGKLGWISVFTLIYPLESAAYTLPKDSISKPIRTDIGYHLVKVNDTRKNSGTVKVRHIFKHLPATANANETNTQYARLDSIKTLIQNGSKFEEMVLRFSDDFNSRDRGGELLPFGISTRVEPAFEEAAFALKQNEISSPVQTSSGLHLIQLIEKYKPETKAKFLELNRNRFITDSRAEYLMQQRLKKLKKAYNLKITEDTQNNAVKYSNVKILDRNWQKPTVPQINETLFSIKDKSYTLNSFYDYVLERQPFEKWTTQSPAEIFKFLLDKFVQKSLIDYQENELVNTNQEIKQWLDAHVENQLYTIYIDDFVTSKSLNDTLALKKLYEENRSKFAPKEIGQMKVLSFDSQETYDQFLQLTAGQKPYNLYRKMHPILFNSNEYRLDEATERKLQGLVHVLQKNNNYVVEIGGHVDVKENEEISELRIREVVQYLLKNQVPLKQILEVNYKSSSVQDRFDWSKNQAVSLHFFSNDEADFAQTLNAKKEDAMTVENFKITRNDYESKMKSNWANKTAVVNTGGRIEKYTLRVSRKNVTYKDYTSDLVDMYQKQLLSDIEKRLKAKYSTQYNIAEINSIINEIKKDN